MLDLIITAGARTGAKVAYLSRARGGGWCPGSWIEVEAPPS